MADYYFDPTASGSSGAGTFANPFRNQAQLQAGFPDSGGHRLLFKRGTRWRPGPVGVDGNFTGYLIPARVFAHSNNVIDAYGDGAKPIIDGSIDLTAWSLAPGQSDVYQAAMSAQGNNNYYLAPGHLARNGAIPYLTRWAGSLPATIGQWIEYFAHSFDVGNGVWYLRNGTAPGTVKAAYWRMCVENSIASKVYGCAIRNIRFEHFSGYPMIFTGMDGGVIDACEGFGIGGDFRSAFSYYEGNFFDIRAGCDNLIAQNNVIEDVFDSGISPQFGQGWNAWNTLSNVTVRNNVFRRCGLGGLEIVPQSPNGCLIDGVLIEGNTFEQCGKGPFRNASTSGGGGSAIGLGLGNWGPATGLTSLVTNVTARRNRFIDCRISQGWMPYAAQMRFEGNIATMSPSVVQPFDAAIHFVRPFDVGGATPLRVEMAGNIIVGYPDVIAPPGQTNVRPIEFNVRRNTIVDCTRMINALGQPQSTYRLQNNTLLRVGTAATGLGGAGSSLTSEGGHYLSSVGTIGFTPAGTDALNQPAPSFVANSLYVPAPGSPLYSGGVNANTGYIDPNGVSFAAYGTSRNAYAVAPEGGGGGDPGGLGTIAWEGRKVPVAMLNAANAAAAAAPAGTKNTAFLTAIRDAIGVPYRRYLVRDNEVVFVATGSTEIPIVGQYLELPTTAAQTGVATADIDTGFWVHYLRHQSDATKYVATLVGPPGLQRPATLTRDLEASSQVQLGAFRLRSPLDDVPLTMTLSSASAVGTDRATFSLTVAGSVPAGALIQIQITASLTSGPWISSQIWPGAAGTFVHEYIGLTPGTTYYVRAFVYDGASPAIYLQSSEPYASFATVATAGTGAQPPSTLSAQRMVDLMSLQGSARGAPDDNFTAWGYNSHQYGGLNGISARLKHRTNAYTDPNCTVTPWIDLLATLYVKWLTTAFKFPRDGNSNVGLEMVPMPAHARIDPSLNGGQIQWIPLISVSGGVSAGYIATSGTTVASPPTSDILNNGRIIRMPGDQLMHPWAQAPGGSILHPITSLVSRNPADPYADSRVDCIACAWWVRVVPFNPALPINHDLNANPVILTAAADPYVNFPRTNNGVPMPDYFCQSPIGSSGVVRVGTSWTQVGYFTSTDAPDRYQTGPGTGISNAAFLANPPPGYA